VAEPTDDPHHFLAELGRSGAQFAAAELRLMLREQLAAPPQRS
jgi:hypothetical protein